MTFAALFRTLPLPPEPQDAARYAAAAPLRAFLPLRTAGGGVIYKIDFACGICDQEIPSERLRAEIDRSHADSVGIHLLINCAACEWTRVFVIRQYSDGRVLHRNRGSWRTTWLNKPVHAIDLLWRLKLTRLLPARWRKRL